MGQRKHCIYCDKLITKRSSEHVIQNALGGLYESEDICCPECNNYISKHIDAPFTKIFNPIISRIENFSKTNNTKSMPPCTGKAVYKDKIYDVNIKADKVVSCPQLSRELRSDISNLPLQIVSYDFDLDNDAFKTGIAKIAFNYAMAQNVDFKYLESGLKVERVGHVVNNIQYDYQIVPFSPLNPLDNFIESDDKTDLYHNMILFSQCNQLWCYVDLFNVFQYYVLLSDCMPDDVYSNYTQTLRKIDRQEPVLDNLIKPKDIMICAQQYGVKPCMDMQEFARRVKNAVARKSQKVPMQEIISPKISGISFADMCKLSGRPGELSHFALAMQLYFDDDVLQERNFRTVTPSVDGCLMSYPGALAESYSHNTDKLKQYTMMKFYKLNNLLCKKSK